MQVLVASLLALMWMQPDAPKQAQDKKPLTLNFGVYQSEKATAMYRKFSPVLEFMNDDLDARLHRSVDVKLTIFKSYEEAIEALVRGEIDFARFGPASYITAKAKQSGIELLGLELDNGERTFKGAIVVGKDSPIQSLADLKGKRFAFGDQNSTIGRYLAQAELVQAGIHAEDLRGFQYLGRHDTVASAIEIGDYDAGSLRLSVLKDLNKRGALRVLTTFENVGQPWVARAGLDPDLLENLRRSLFAIKDPTILKDLKITGIVPTSDDEYRVVREGMKHAEEFATAARGN